MKKYSHAIFIVLETITIFLLTKNSLTGPFRLQLTLLCLLLFIVLGAVLRKKGIALNSNYLFLYLGVSVILFLVGVTGWFLSPFFFSLYLLGIFLSFVFSTTTALAFILTMVAIFSFYIGEVDVTYDVMVVLSLLTTIPLTIFLRKEYLRLKEKEKEILILQKEKEHYKNKVEEVLANTIINFAVVIRQPINDTKQLAYRLSALKDKKQKDLYQKRIVHASDEALGLLKKFEEDATGKKLLTTLETS